MHRPLTRYVNVRVAHAPDMPWTFTPPPRVSNPDMHHGTCVTHVPWCMPGSITDGFLRSRRRGKRSRHSRRMRNPQSYVSGWEAHRDMSSCPFQTKIAHMNLYIYIINSELIKLQSLSWGILSLLLQTAFIFFFSIMYILCKCYSIFGIHVFVYYVVYATWKPAIKLL